MSNNTNSTIIGLFVIGAVAIVLASIVFFSGGDILREKERFVLYFDRTVQGLEIGAPVKLRGVKLGEVTSIQTHVVTNQRAVINAVYIETYPGEIRWDNEAEADRMFDEMLERDGMRAQLRIQSMLTGLLYIEVDFKPGAQDQKLYGLDPHTREIPTAPTEIEELSDILNEIDFQEIASSFQRIADNLDKFVSDDNFLALAANINSTLASIKKLADNADQTVIADLHTAIGQINTFMAALNEDYPTLAGELSASLQSLKSSLVQIENALAGAEHLLSDDSPVLYEVNSTLRELKKASRELGALAETLDRHPEAIMRGKQPQTGK